MEGGGTRVWRPAEARPAVKPPPSPLGCTQEQARADEEVTCAQVKLTKALEPSVLYQLQLPAGARYSALSGPVRADTGFTLAGLRPFRLPFRTDFQMPSRPSQRVFDGVRCEAVRGAACMHGSTPFLHHPAAAPHACLWPQLPPPGLMAAARPRPRQRPRGPWGAAPRVRAGQGRAPHAGAVREPAAGHAGAAPAVQGQGGGGGARAAAAPQVLHPRAGGARHPGRLWAASGGMRGAARGVRSGGSVPQPPRSAAHRCPAHAAVHAAPCTPCPPRGSRAHDRPVRAQASSAFFWTRALDAHFQGPSLSGGAPVAVFEPAAAPHAWPYVSRAATTTAGGVVVQGAAGNIVGFCR